MQTANLAETILETEQQPLFECLLIPSYTSLFLSQCMISLPYSGKCGFNSLKAPGISSARGNTVQTNDAILNWSSHQYCTMWPFSSLEYGFSLLLHEYGLLSPWEIAVLVILAFTISKFEILLFWGMIFLEFDLEFWHLELHLWGYDWHCVIIPLGAQT